MKQVVVAIPLQEKEKKQFIEEFLNYNFKFCERNEIKDNLVGTNVIIGLPTVDEMKKAPDLEWVQADIAGVDSYVNREDYPRNITLTNVTGAFGFSISEYLLTMVLSLYKKMHLYRDQQQKEIWEDKGKEKTLFHKTVLIVGTGDIGSSFAKLLAPFGTKTIGIRRTECEGLPYFDEVHTTKELDQWLPKADIVALCLPSTHLTKGLMNKERFLSMKKDSVLLNVGRGNTVVLDDLIEVLEMGHLDGVALDVFEIEPLPKGHPIWQQEKVIVTPHISGISFAHLDETYEKIVEICKENLRRYEKGEPLKNKIDFETGYCESK